MVRKESSYFLKRDGVLLRFVRWAVLDGLLARRVGDLQKLWVMVGSAARSLHPRIWAAEMNVQ